MFRDRIDKPIDPIPMEYVNTLHRLDDEPDYSLTCLGIAMLRPRIENYKGISGVYKNLTDEISCVRDFIELSQRTWETPALCYYMYRNNCEDRAEMMQMLDDNGFIVKENIGAFIKTQASLNCFAVYHKDNNFAGIFINSSEIRFYHILISFVSLLFPNLFTTITMRKPEDYNIVIALSKQTKDLFVQRIQEATQQYTVEFRQIMLSTLLKGIHESKIAHALQDVTQARSYVENVKLNLSDAIASLRNYIVTYEGLKATESYDKPEEDLVEYLATNKNIHNLTVNGSRLTFSVSALLNNYNEDAWAAFKRRGAIYDGQYRTDSMLDAFRTKENRQILLDNLFSESPDFSVKLAGNYTMDIQNCHLTTDRGYDYNAADPMYKSYIPNPHLKLFNCLGGYERRVAEALEKRDYILAVELCCASAGSVNLEETEQTFRPFLGWLLSSREKVLRRKDGVDMTPEEALVWLIDKENANETN